ncbi:Hypothetical protein, putative [Bodo saltans]|uniref:WW domain-containing protein n=1 Tax=Bodo saltans TaxID=75058 RepID=A0A0S4IX43_BODSA|nr:Hypothetical protein, putative [Bodo saltans]|eukprot:CUG06623.1 Hypothetical protein, putative [Bodo saltans]
MNEVNNVAHHEVWASALVFPSQQPTATLTALSPQKFTSDAELTSTTAGLFSIALTSSVDEDGPVIPFSSFDVICAEHGSVELSDPLAFPHNLFLIAPPGSAGVDLPSTPFQPILEGPSFRRLLEEPYRNGRNSVLCLRQAAAVVADVDDDVEARREPICPHELMIGTPDAFGLLPLVLKMVYEFVAPALASPRDENVNDDERFVDAGVEPLVIQTSFIALTTNTCLDLSGGAPSEEGESKSTAKQPSPRIDIVEGGGPHMLTGSSWQFSNERRMMSRTLDDALETLDLGLDALAHAVDTNVVRGESVCTLVFTVYFHTPRHTSSLTIVNIGQDESLLKWLDESLAGSTAARAATASAPSPPNTCHDNDDVSSSYVPQPLHHHAATLLIPLICKGDFLVGTIFSPPPLTSHAFQDEKGRVTFQLAIDNAARSKLLCNCVTQRPPLPGSAFSSLLDMWRYPTAAASTSLESQTDVATNPSRGGELPLPLGWEAMMTDDGRVYYVDHIHRCTTWEHPCSSPSGGAGDEGEQNVDHNGSSSREGSGGRQYITTTTTNREDSNNSSAAELFSVDHDQQCWGAAGSASYQRPQSNNNAGAGTPPFISNVSEISLMIMDPDMVAPRVILSGSRDVSAVVEQEIASASANTPRVAGVVGAPSYMALNAETNHQGTTPTATVVGTPTTTKLFASPEQMNEVTLAAVVSAGIMSPSSVNNGAGEIIACGDMNIIVPAGVAEELRSAGGGATTLTDDAAHSISTTNFIEDLARSISSIGSSHSSRDSDGPEAERDAAALEDVRYYLARPSTDDEKIESFLFELESILKRSIEAETRTKQLELENAELRSLLSNAAEARSIEESTVIVTTATTTTTTTTAPVVVASEDGDEVRNRQEHSSSTHILTAIANLTVSKSYRGAEIVLSATSTTSGPTSKAATSDETVILRIVESLLQEHHELAEQLSILQQQQNKSESLPTTAHQCTPEDHATICSENEAAADDDDSHQLHAEEASSSAEAGHDDGATTISVVKHRQLLHELDRAMYKKHVDIVARLCEKQKDVIRNLYSDFDLSLKEAHQRNEELEQQFNKTTAELEGWKLRSAFSATEQRQNQQEQHHQSPQQRPRSPKAMMPHPAGTMGAVFGIAALGSVQEPSPSLRRYGDDDDDDDVNNNEIVEDIVARRVEPLHHVAFTNNEFVLRESSSNAAVAVNEKRGVRDVRLSLLDSLKETDSEHALLVREDRSNDVLLHDQAELLARIQRYRSRQQAETSYADHDEVNHHHHPTHHSTTASLQTTPILTSGKSPTTGHMYSSSNSNHIRSTSPLSLPATTKSPSGNVSSTNYRHQSRAPPALLPGAVWQAKRTAPQSHRGSSPFTNPVTAVDLLKQRHSNIQQLMSETQQRTPSSSSQRAPTAVEQLQLHPQFLASAEEVRQYSMSFESSIDINRAASTNNSTGPSPLSKTRRTASPNSAKSLLSTPYSSPINAADLMRRYSSTSIASAVGRKSTSPLQRSYSSGGAPQVPPPSSVAGNPYISSSTAANQFCIPGAYRQVHSPKRLVRNGQGSNHALLRVPNSRSTSAGAHEIDPYTYHE